jgi:glycosyltransferase involved in cell wall biosynthesis/GT2 family glycosyltransferase
LAALRRRLFFAAWTKRIHRPKNIAFRNEGDAMPVEARLVETAASAPKPRTVPARAPYKGFVEVYGYHGFAGGWFFIGWITRRDDLAEIFATLQADFTGFTLQDPATALFFPREDVGHEGVGFLAFLPPATPSSAIFLGLRLRLRLGAADQTLPPITQAHHLPEAKLIPQLHHLLAQSHPGPPRHEMQLLLGGPDTAPAQGFVEYFGHHPGAGGWLVSGWLGPPGDETPPDRLVLSFEDGDIRGDALFLPYARPELHPGARGVIFFLPGQPAAFGPLRAVSLRGGTRLLRMTLLDSTPQLREAELTARIKTHLAAAHPGLSRDRLTNLLARLPYAGEDNFGRLRPRILLYIDKAIRCGTDGIILLGWLLSAPNELQSLRLCTETASWPMPEQNFVKIDRPDVLAEFSQLGFDDPACGFMTYIQAAIDPQTPLWIEATTKRWETAYRRLAHPSRTGLDAIRHLLGMVDFRFAAFDRALGPAVAALNRERLNPPLNAPFTDYGQLPAAPKHSVIIPLHGRLDFVETQMALFSTHDHSDTEFIYVLDDPPKRRESETLFASIFARFRIPFRAVLLPRNLGFAPATNAGLRLARGEFVAYLNSDVFPGTPDWLEQLAARLRANPQLGAIGPLLLYEDGSVQHRGTTFRRQPEYANWYFCHHPDKALRYTGDNSLQPLAITGACMVLRRALANQLGGLDEIYAIGDFEDSDLCLKLRDLGLACAVDSTIRLHHPPPPSRAPVAAGQRQTLARQPLPPTMPGSTNAAGAAKSPKHLPGTPPMPDARLRILIAAHAHPERSNGGAEIAAFELFRALQAEGNTDTWFLGCDRAAEKSGAPLQQPFSASEYLYATSTFDWFKFANRDPHFPAAITELFQRLAPDIAHFHHYMNFGVEIFLLLKRAVPSCKILLTLHEYLAICHHYGQMVTTDHHTLCHQSSAARCHKCFPDFSPADFFLRKLYIERFFALIDHFIAPSDFLAERYIAWGIPREKITVLENLLPATPTPPASPPPPEPLRLGFFGQISKLKGIDVLFDAAALLAEDSPPPPISFEIFGDYRGQPTEFQSAFLARLAKAGPNIRFHGPYERARVDALMQSVHAVLVPSIWWENSPVVIQEALRNRRPVICSDIGGMAEKIRDNIDGLHFPPWAAQCPSPPSSATSPNPLPTSPPRQPQPPPPCKTTSPSIPRSAPTRTPRTLGPIQVRDRCGF